MAPDPFVAVAGGRCFFRYEDLLRLVESRRSARLGAGSQHTVAVAGLPIRRLADVRIEGR